MPETPSPLIDAILTGHFEEKAGYQVLRPAGTTDYLLTLTFSGRGIYRVGKTTVSALPGDVVLLHPRTPHDYRAGDDGWSFVWAHFHPRPHWSTWLGGRERAAGLHHFALGPSDAAEAGRLLLKVHAQASGHRPLQQHLARAILEQALILCAATHGARAGIDARIERSIESLACRASSPLDIAALAREAKLSPSRFAHLFSEQIGETPLQFHERLRIDLARRLLSATSLTVKEVAGQCGFASPFYFSLRFKRATGKSPSAWRGA